MVGKKIYYGCRGNVGNQRLVGGPFASVLGPFALSLGPLSSDLGPVSL
jgi:hypothetical protein